MKNFRNRLIVLLFIAFASTSIGTSQDSSSNELSYEVNRVYPAISITKENLNDAHTIMDLNKHYKSSWIKEYISVEILTTYNGKTLKAFSNSDNLSKQQKDNLIKADAGSDIEVNVHYIPDNTLKHNDIKEINFIFSVDPELEAEYPGGQEELNQYLKDSVADEIFNANFKQYQLAAVKFTIDEHGSVINPHVFWTSEDDKIDKLLLEAIQKMLNWKPAEYANGMRIKQEFVFTVGDMESCVVNLLNINQD